MRIGLIDVDGHNYPNLALMKLSTWHKAQGDTVEWWWTDMIYYDIVYMSKVFSEEYSPHVPEPLNAGQIIKGGTGYAIHLENGKEVYSKEFDKPLDGAIEHQMPDYSLYDTMTADTAYGFLTRGCPRGCGFCHVKAKEGARVVQVADLHEFWTHQRHITLMDPNILASPNRESLLYDLQCSRAYIDFNQGLDIRLMDETVATLLGRMRVKCLHFAWDNPKENLAPFFERFSGWYSRKDPKGKVVYVLTNYNSTFEEDLHRVYTLRDLGYDPYVMVYNKANAPQDVRYLQRWCNNRIIFKTVRNFREYNPKLR